MDKHEKMNNHSCSSDCCEDVYRDWRSWGSWFSWGSPIGLSLGFAIFLISIGFFLVLLHWSGLIG